VDMTYICCKLPNSLKGKPETGILPADMGRDASATRPP